MIHIDGSRGTNRVRGQCEDGDRWYEYPRYFFTNTSDDIRRLFTDALDILGTERKQSNAHDIPIAKKATVAGLDEFVRPQY